MASLSVSMKKKTASGAMRDPKTFVPLPDEDVEQLSRMALPYLADQEEANSFRKWLYSIQWTREGRKPFPSIKNTHSKQTYVRFLIAAFSNMKVLITDSIHSTYQTTHGEITVTQEGYNFRAYPKPEAQSNYEGTNALTPLKKEDAQKFTMEDAYLMALRAMVDPDTAPPHHIRLEGTDEERAKLQLALTRLNDLLPSNEKRQIRNKISPLNVIAESKARAEDRDAYAKIFGRVNNMPGLQETGAGRMWHNMQAKIGTMMSNFGKPALASGFAPTVKKLEEVPTEIDETVQNLLKDAIAANPNPASKKIGNALTEGFVAEVELNSIDRTKYGRTFDELSAEESAKGNNIKDQLVYDMMRLVNPQPYEDIYGRDVESIPVEEAYALSNDMKDPLVAGLYEQHEKTARRHSARLGDTTTEISLDSEIRKTRLKESKNILNEARERLENPQPEEKRTIIFNTPIEEIEETENTSVMSEVLEDVTAESPAEATNVQEQDMKPVLIMSPGIPVGFLPPVIVNPTESYDLKHSGLSLANLTPVQSIFEVGHDINKQLESSVKTNSMKEPAKAETINVEQTAKPPTVDYPPEDFDRTYLMVRNMVCAYPETFAGQPVQKLEGIMAGLGADTSVKSVARMAYTMAREGLVSLDTIDKTPVFARIASFKPQDELFNSVVHNVLNNPHEWVGSDVSVLEKGLRSIGYDDYRTPHMAQAIYHEMSRQGIIELNEHGKITVAATGLLTIPALKTAFKTAAVIPSAQTAAAASVTPTTSSSEELAESAQLAKPDDEDEMARAAVESGSIRRKQPSKEDLAAREKALTDNFGNGAVPQDGRTLTFADLPSDIRDSWLAETKPDCVPAFDYKAA